LEDQPVKNLFRKEPSLCPACKSDDIHFRTTIPYFKTHQKWGTDIDTYMKVVPAKYSSCIFEMYYCKYCEFVYVPASYADIVQIVEEHPLYPEKIIKPYLLQTQKFINRELASKILSSPHLLDTIDQRFNIMRSLITLIYER
jgi:hypothetical protein